jgi:hypothetical protein
MPQLELVIESGNNQFCAVNSLPGEDLVMRIQYRSSGSEPPVKAGKSITYPSILINIDVIDPDGTEIVSNYIINTDENGFGMYTFQAVENPGLYHVIATIDVSSYPEFGFWNAIDYQLNIIQISVTNIDATDPYNTIINFNSHTSLPSVTFTAHGNVIETLSDVTGEFSFSYNQESLIIGDNHLILTTPAGDLDIVASVEQMEAHDLEVSPSTVVANFDTNYILPSPITHEGHIFYNKITYQLSDSYILSVGKTVKLNSGLVKISTVEGTDVPSEIAMFGNEPMWSENHYFIQNGQSTYFTLTTTTEATIPPQSSHYRSKQIDYNNLYIDMSEITGFFNLYEIFYQYDPYTIYTWTLIPPTELELLIENTYKGGE